MDTVLLTIGRLTLLQHNSSFVVCTDYDGNLPDGERWIYGHYFTFTDELTKAWCLMEAVRYFMGREEVQAVIGKGE